MSLVTPEGFGLLFFVLIASIVPWGLCLVILHFLMPTALLERYWKQPYFRFSEVVFFDVGGWNLMRTIMLTGGIAFPRLGTTRGITDAYQFVPPWYRLASKVFCWWGWIALYGVVGISTGLVIYSRAIGDPKQGAWTAIIGGLLFFLFISWLLARAFWPRRQR